MTRLLLLFWTKTRKRTLPLEAYYTGKGFVCTPNISGTQALTKCPSSVPPLTVNTFHSDFYQVYSRRHSACVRADAAYCTVADAMQFWYRHCPFDLPVLTFLEVLLHFNYPFPFRGLCSYYLTPPSSTPKWLIPQIDLNENRYIIAAYWRTKPRRIKRKKKKKI
jgi:hypothetical protein